MGDDAPHPPLDPRRQKLLESLLIERGLKFPAIPRADRGARLRASFEQERAWLLSRLEDDLPVQNVTKGFWLNGMLNEAALEDALCALVARHESLRTVFEEADGGLFQVIKPSSRVVFERPSLVFGDVDECRRAVSALVAAEARRPIDLERGPLLRAVLATLAPGTNVFVLTVHHIVADGWSSGLLVRELCTLYGNATGGQSVALPDLPIQYADYATWQRAALHVDGITAGLAHFRSRLVDAPPPVELPVSVPPISPRSADGGEVPVVLAPELERRLHAFARGTSSTLFEVLFAALAALLHRYSGALDLVIGTPFANRTRQELEGVVGLFANTVAVRVDFSEQPSFEALVGRVRSEVRGAANHQAVPFQHVVREVRRGRSMGGSLFNVWFALQNWPMPKLSLEGLRAEPVPVEAQAVEFDLSLDLWRANDRLGGRLEFARSSFARPAAARIAGHYAEILDRLMERPTSPVGEVAFTSRDERQAVLTMGRGPRARLRPVLDRILEQTGHRGEKPAAIEGGKVLTYRELHDRSDALAVRLRAAGVGQEGLAALVLHPGIDLAIAVIAVLKTGGAFVLIDPDTPRLRVVELVESARPVVVISHGVLEIEVEVMRAAAPATVADHSELRLAYVVYTSGSTGAPKGVAVPHRCLAAYVDAAVDAFALTSGDRVLQFAPVGFDVLIEELFPAWAVGGAVVFRGNSLPMEPHEFMTLVAEQAITIVEVSNLYWELLGEAIQQGRVTVPPALRLLLVGCGRMPTQRVRDWRKTGVALIHVYGLSEVTVTSTVCDLSRWSVDEHSWPYLPLGRPVNGSLVYVLDANLQPVAIGVRGEIYLGGDLVARGYWGAAEQTAERFVPDPFDDRPGARMFRTGDAGRLLEDGSLDFFGRTDDQVKVRGFRVELAEIDSALVSHPHVREAASLAIADGLGESRIFAFVAGRDGCELERASLRTHLLSRLPAYMCPSQIVVLPRLPQTANGKVDRATLRASTQADQPRDKSRPLATPTELAVATVWRDLLGVDQVDAEDDFFVLGGHSLLAMKVAARLREELDIELPARSMFDAPVLANLASLIDSLPGRARPIRISARDAFGDAPASFAQEHLWFLHQLDPDSSAYNLPTAVRLLGVLDVDALRASFELVCDRHEILRTVLFERDGMLFQRVFGRGGVGLDVIDLSMGPDGDGEVRRRVLEEAQRPFSLHVAPPVRAMLFRLDSETHVLSLTLHHSMADEWSLGLFVEELTESYRDIVSGRRPQLAPLRVQFADYAIWQRREEAERGPSQLAYWSQQLAGCDHGTVLPTDYPRLPVGTAAGATLGFRVSSDTAREMQVLARRSGVTPAAMYLAAFAALLRRRCPDGDIVVGMPAANRGHPDTQRLIGCLLNTVVIRASFDAKDSFLELADRIHHTIVDALSNADVPFERVVEAIRPARDLSHHPLFQIMFSFEQSSPHRERMGSLVIEPYGVHTGAAQFDLTLDVTSQGETATGVLCFATDLYAEETVAGFRDEYVSFLDNAVRASKRPLHELWSPGPHAKLIADWNATSGLRLARPHLGALFLETMRRHGAAAAVISSDESVSYAALAERAAAVTRSLLDMSVGVDDVVAVAVRSGVPLAVAALGVWFAGAALLPLDPEQPAARLSACLLDAGAKAVIVEPGVEGTFELEERQIPRLTLVRTDRASLDEVVSTLAIPPSALAYVTFTSGSTGRPKAVALPHEALINFALDMAQRLGLGPGDRVLQFAPVEFDVLLEELLPAWAAGAAVVLGAVTMPPDPRDLLETLTRFAVTHVELPSRYWEQVFAEAVNPPPTLRAVLLGCDPPNHAAVERWVSCGVPLLHVFGLAETAITSTTWWSSESSGLERAGELPIGRPIANTTAYVLDDLLAPVPIGVPGQLYIGGLGLARGYLQRPELTAERFVPNPFSMTLGARLYRTGDRARWRSDGALEFLGRLDHQVKVRGFRIELGEVEAALRGHTAVVEACAWTEPTSAGSVRLVAAVEVAESSSLDATSLRQYLRSVVPGYMVPSRINSMQSFPRTVTGKLDRARIRTAQAPAERAGESLALTGVAKELAEAWREALRVPEAGPSDNFFEVGGDSLTCLTLVARARARGIQLSPKDVFQHQTLGELSTIVQRFSVVPAPSNGGRFARARVSEMDLERLLSHVERIQT